MVKNHIIGKLKEKGSRITKTRKAICEIISNSKKPISAACISELLLEKSISVNKTTVYRELAFLLDKGFILQVFIDPKRLFYESTYLPHHHHFVCQDCGQLEDVYLDNELKEVEKKLEQKNKAKIKHHSLEFFGLCKNCA